METSYEIKITDDLEVVFVKDEEMEEEING